jgi:hypothetical protein
MSRVKYKIGEVVIYHQKKPDVKQLVNGKKYTIANIGFYMKISENSVFYWIKEDKQNNHYHIENFITEKELRKLKIEKINESRR